MNEEHTQKLITEHPLLYRNGIYFDCGDGWFGLLQDLSDKLEALIAKSEPPEIEGRNCYAVQVKEKYGTLRFYMSCETDEMSDLIEAAEDKSSRTCENCGAFGYIRKFKWIRTLCDQCCLPKSQ